MRVEITMDYFYNNIEYFYKKYKFMQKGCGENDRTSGIIIRIS